MSVANEIARLDASLRRRFRVIDTPVALGGATVTLAHPANTDELISEEDYLRDERLPYWAEPWPSSFALARHLVSSESLLGGGANRRLLELGCGAGLVAAAATLAGFDVTASDYYEDALLFARANVERNGGRRVRTRMVDWREFPEDLGTFDRVIASDVLYEMTYAPLVARAIALSLGRDGVAGIATYCQSRQLAGADKALRNVNRQKADIDLARQQVADTRRNGRHEVA